MMSSTENTSNGYGQVITFYSYKGGTGRTMALSNVACILAKQSPAQNRVLMIDWDLEAPGLHRFFFKNRTPSSQLGYTTDALRELDEKPGLIYLFSKIESTIRKSKLKDDEELAKEALDRIKFEDYIIETQISNLSLMKAGRFGEKEKYSTRVYRFNWQRLFNRSPSLFRLFVERLTERYTYILVDSRTGYSDTSGICTMLLRQKLVVVFTPNRQSYTGVKELVKRATNYRRRSDDLRPLLVYPLPSRIEGSYRFMFLH